MKKIMSLLLAAVMLLSFAACSNNGGKTAEATPELTADPTPEIHQITDEEIFAAKVLIKGSHLFNEPLSVKVKNVWIYKEDSTLDNFYLTYELDVKNSAGIMENVYYGTARAIEDLSDKSLEKVLDDIGWSVSMTILGSPSSSSYFKKNAISAMQNGDKLDAESIQEYFLKNFK